MSDHWVSTESYILYHCYRSHQRSTTRLSGPGAEIISDSHRIVILLMVAIAGRALVHIYWCPRLHLRNCRGTFRATESGNSSCSLSFVTNYMCHLGLGSNLPGFSLMLSLHGMISHALHSYPGGRNVVALPTRSPLCAHRVE